MDEERKKRITEIEAGERHKKRAQSQHAFFERLRGLVKLVLIVTICAFAFIYRVEVAKVCHSVFDRAMKHLTLSPQTRQKSVDYQNQLDGIITNN